MSWDAVVLLLSVRTLLTVHLGGADFMILAKIRSLSSPCSWGRPHTAPFPLPLHLNVQFGRPAPT